MLKVSHFLIAMAGSLFAVNSVSADPWRQYETTNFILYSNVSEDLSRSYAVELEQYQFILSDYFAIPYDTSQARKPEVYLLDSDYQFTQTRPGIGTGVMGYMKMCEQGMGAFALNLGDAKMAKNAVSNKRQNFSQIVIFHEYAHDFMYRNNSQILPSWYVEGFAEYFSTIAFEGDQLVVGLSAGFRGFDLEQIQRWPSYADLLTFNQKRSKKGSEYFHARSWLLTHYILSHPELRLRLDDYLAAYQAGEDPIESFERIMGIKVSDLDRLLRDYVSKDLKATVYRLNTMPTPEVEITLLPPSSNRLLPWDAAVKTCPDDDYKPKLLKQIRSEATKHESTPYSRLVLARAETVIGDKAKAITLLESYTLDFPEDAEGWSLLGQALYLQAKEDADGAEAMAAARNTLSKAYKMKPEEPRTLYYLSLAQGNDGSPNATALNAALQAYYLSPSVFEYAKRASMVLIMSDRTEEARAILLPISDSAHKSKITMWVNMVLDAINEGKSQAEILALFSINIKDLPDPDKKK